jgi:hypothetical protein
LALEAGRVQAIRLAKRLGEIDERTVLTTDPASLEAVRAEAEAIGNDLRSIATTATVAAAALLLAG